MLRGGAVSSDFKAGQSFDEGQLHRSQPRNSSRSK
jgi:hypothetical protein